MEFIKQSGSGETIFDFLASDEKNPLTLPCMGSTSTKGKLTQWGLEGILTASRFRFTGKYAARDSSNFLRQLFSSSVVLAGIPNASPVQQSVQATKLSCSVLSMSFFDCLTEKGIVGPTGSMRGCMDEIFDGLSVSDRLREALVNPESESGEIFEEEQRQELIYHVFKALVLGGAMCQPEDNISSYLDITKAIYKDIVSVYKGQEGRIEVASHAYVIHSLDGEVLRLFGSESRHHVCLVVVDPIKKQVTVLTKVFKPFW